MTAKGMCCTRTVFHPKTALERERWKTKWWNWELFQMICPFLYRALSRPSPLIFPCLPFYLPLSPSLTLSFASCTSVCFISETINGGLCVRCKGWHWGRSQDPRVRRGYQSRSLSPCGNLNLWGGGVKVKRRHGARVPWARDTLSSWFVEGSGWDEQEARLMLKPATESTRGN